MRNPTFTFGDMALCFQDEIPERKCRLYDFPSWSVSRKPTPSEMEEDCNVCLVIENQVFFYRPFVMHNPETDKKVRL